MIEITKEIAHKLNQECGIPFGAEGISVTGTRRKYYLCEINRNFKALKNLKTKKN